MNLLLDIGNSRVKWATIDGDRWLVEGSARLADQGTGWPLLDQLEAAPRRVLAVNVAGAAIGDGLRERLASRWQLPLELASTAAEFAGLRNGYRDPLQLGTDRWLAMIAARDAASGALCVVDAGTALTVDLIEADGLHLGGFILPGPELLRHALERSTGELRQRAARPAQAASLEQPGRDTRSAIEAAAVQAAIGLIQRAMTMTSTPPRLVLSGGGAAALLGGLPEDLLPRPRLVLEGLRLAMADRTEPAGA